MPSREELQARIEAYLLGRLPEEEQTRIEALLFEDRNAIDLVRDTEDHLIDRYLAAELSAEDRAAFEHVFATSSSRRERIAFARALGESLADDAAVDDAIAVAVTATGRRGWVPSVPRIVLPAAAIAAAVVVGLVARDRADAPPPLSPALVTPAPPPSTAQRQGMQDTATILLPRADLRRSTGTLPRVRIPAGAAEVRLLPQIEASDAPGPYAATLRRVEGPIVWRGTTADSERGRTSVTIPAHWLTAGDYVLRLAHAGAGPEDALEYPFRISTEPEAGAPSPSR